MDKQEFIETIKTFEAVLKEATDTLPLHSSGKYFANVVELECIILRKTLDHPDYPD